MRRLVHSYTPFCPCRDALDAWRRSSGETGPAPPAFHTLDGATRMLLQQKATALARERGLRPFR